MWDGVSWEAEDDYRGTTYWLPTAKHGDQGIEVKDLGALPEGSSLAEPEETLEELKTKKLRKLSSLTAAKITGGFTSSATGQEVKYDSDMDTQVTMQGIEVNAEQIDTVYPTGVPVRGYVGDSDAKTIQYVSGEQVKQWLADLSMHIGTCKQWGWEKQAEINACGTIEELEKIILE